MKKGYGIIIFLVLLILTVSCNNNNIDAPATELPATEPSTTIPASESENEKHLKIDGSTSTLPIVRAIYSAIYPEGSNYPESASKTVPSYEMLIDGELDLIIVPYASSDVIALAEQKDVQLEFVPIAAEALIFITPEENTASNITLEQVREIYLNYGIKNWNELGGPDRELIPICRNSDSGSQSQMDNLVLNNEKMHSSIQKNYVELTMEGMLELVAFYHSGGLSGKPTASYALGYTLYSYLENITEITGIGDRLRILSFDGIEPTEQSISDGTYPLTDAYYAVIRNDMSEDTGIREVISWLESESGVAAIKRAGFISISGNLTKPNWRGIYADYLSKEDFEDYYGFYIGDINSDGVPEIAIRYNELTNNGVMLCFVDNKLQVLELNVVSIWGDVGYLEETNQIIFLQWYGHTQATFGSVNFYLFEWTPNGYTEAISVIRESGYDTHNNGAGEYGQGYINGEKADFDEFEIVLAEMYTLLEKSTWFPMTDFDEVEDYSDYFIQWELTNHN